MITGTRTRPFTIRFLLFLAFAASATPAAVCQTKVLRAAVISDFPPLYRLDSLGKPEGLAIDILDSILPGLGYGVEYLVVANWGEADRALREGRADFVPGIGVDDERLAEFAFSSHPMETVPIQAFIRRSTRGIDGPDDLGGRSVAVLRDSVAWSILRRDASISLIVCDRAEEIVMALLSGKADAAACPGPMLRLKLSELKLEDRIRATGEPLAELKRCYMFRRDDAAFLRERIDPALAELTASPRYRELYLKWYGKPEPFWTAGRIGGLSLGALAILLAAFSVVWNLTMRRKNEKLARLASEERAAKRALAASEERYRILFESAPMGIIVAAGRDYTIKYANPAFLRMFGYESSDIGRISAADLAGPDGLGAVAEFAARAGKESRALAEGSPCLRKDGGAVKCDIYASPIPVDRGTVGFFIDASEREKARDGLRQSEKLAAIGQLAGGIAHDFNNQLAGITGYAELLGERLGGSAEEMRLVDGVLTAAKRAADLTRDLLAFARKGKYEEQEIDMPKILQEVAGLASRSVDKRIGISVSAETGGLAVRGDPSQLQNAVLNLVINARDAMPSGGTVKLGCEPLRIDGAEAERLKVDLPPGDYLRICVEDDGTGMGPETLSHLFEPFFTTKEPGKGTGMGLAAVYGTVRNHGGAVRIESEPGKGTSAWFLLPAFAGKPGHPAAGTAPSAASAAPATGRRILLVDDERSILDVGREMLSLSGMLVETAGDGEEAVRVFCSQSRRFDLVLLDMIMPGLSGREVFARMIVSDPAVRVIVTSGYALNGDAQAMLDAGAKGFLHKPFRRQELLDAVESALA